MTEPTLAPAPQIITGQAELCELRTWAFTALARGDAHPAVEAVETAEASTDLRSPLFELSSEIHCRAGIALEDRTLVQHGLAPPLDFDIDEHDPDATAMLARAVGAAWLVDDFEREGGFRARFREGRSWLACARWGLAQVAERPDLAADQRAEASAALRRLYTSAGRILDGAETIRMSRGCPASLKPARDALSRARRPLRMEPLETLVMGSLYVIKQACEPAWPTHGGPWWTSEACGLTIELADAEDEAGRHRLALADALLEFEDLPIPFDDDPAAWERLEALRVSLADAALAHATHSGLAR